MWKLFREPLLHFFVLGAVLFGVGLPQKAMPIALLTFNAGVEIGPLMLVTAVLLAGAALRRLPLSRSASMPNAIPYAIGCVAMFCVIERVGAFAT